MGLVISLVFETQERKKESTYHKSMFEICIIPIHNINHAICKEIIKQIR